jgi:hypothetical protein
MSREDVGLHLRVLLFAPLAPLLLRLPFPRLYLLLEPRSAPPEPDRPDAAAERVRLAVDRALRLERRIVRDTCLTRGLIRYYFLRRRGMEVSLRFGIARNPEEGDGHCWLTLGDRPLFEPNDPEIDFVEIYRFAPRSAAERPARRKEERPV